MAIISTFSMKYIEYCSSKGGSTTSSYDYLLSVTRTYFLLFGDKESDRHTGQQKVHCFPPFNSWNKIKHTHTHKNKTEQQQQQKAETHGSCRSRSSADKSQHCTVFQSGYADLCQLRTWPGSKSWIIKDVSLLWKSSLNGSSCNLGGLRRVFIQLFYLYGVLLPDK